MKQAAIAKKLRISQQTVSRVLNQPELVSDKTRQRVLAAMRELGYQPNELAIRLKGEKLGMIGVCIVSVENSLFPAIVQAIQTTAARHALQTAVACDGGDLQVGCGAMNMMRRLRFDGILATPQEGNQAYFGELLRLKYPFVLFDQRYADLDCPYVGTANRKAARAATDYLLTLGHRRIAMARSHLAAVGLIERYLGYQDAMMAAEISPDPRWIVPGAFSIEAGRALLHRVREIPQSVRPTAIFCDNDTLAAGVILEAFRIGVRVPEQFSVMGFAGHAWGEYLPVPLTTMTQPGARIGQAAVDMLMTLIAGQPLAVRHLELPASLTLRASTGPRPTSGR